ncbi:MAG: phosphohydrolase [Treponema sp.]|jgi:uncharacterized protein|nr:phosphohydrolase [Treponema sp.]
MKDSALFESLSREILGSPVFGQCKNFMQHGKVSVYAHSLSVSRMSFTMAEGIAGLDLRSLVRAALLHDFFLYDWHVPEKMWSLHGWTHPVTAARNARTYFHVSDKEFSLIRTHMWPFTLLHPPAYREGWILCFADKVCSAIETLFRR